MFRRALFAFVALVVLAIPACGEDTAAGGAA